MIQLVFATNNKHKLAEIRDITGKRFDILSLSDIGCLEEIPENEPTIEGNASSKAWYVYNRYGRDCFADDTGLEIEALDGRPGVKSARYAGEDCISENNIQKILHELEEHVNRKARFKTVISLVINGKETRFEGIVDGHILLEKKGAGGFGYDPVFQPQGYAQSFAEMPPSEKNKISHRSRAIVKLIDFLMHPE